jgi:hypothetical protein
VRAIVLAVYLRCVWAGEAATGWIRADPPKLPDFWYGHPGEGRGRVGFVRFPDAAYSPSKTATDGPQPGPDQTLVGQGSTNWTFSIQAGALIQALSPCSHPAHAMVKNLVQLREVPLSTRRERRRCCLHGLAPFIPVTDERCDRVGFEIYPAVPVCRGIMARQAKNVGCRMP